MIFWQVQSTLGSHGSREPLKPGSFPSRSAGERGGVVAGALMGHDLPGTSVRFGGEGRGTGQTAC